MKAFRLRLLVFFLSAGALAPSIAQAACASPAGAEGDMIYNSTHHMMQFCDGADWIAMAASNGSSGSGDYASGLVGHWAFDEGAGTTTADTSGNGNTGTLYNGPTWTTGVSGGAIHFDGTDDYVDAGSPAALDDLSAMTVCAWANLDSWNTTYPTVVSKNDANGWQLYTAGGGGFTFGFDSRQSTGVGSDNALGAVAQISPGEWSFLCATSDGTTNPNGLTLYYGRSTASGLEGIYLPPRGTSSWGGTVSDAASILRIGTGEGNFQGKIDDVFVYNRALSYADIFALYMATRP